MDIDLMGAQPALFKLYTQLAFVFAARHSASQSSITEIMTLGLERLSQHFPWVAGQVMNAIINAAAPPLYKIRPFEQFLRLFVKNYADDASMPGLTRLHQAGCPMPMLGKDHWAPCPTLPISTFDLKKICKSATEPAPVVLYN